MAAGDDRFRVTAQAVMISFAKGGGRDLVSLTGAETVDFMLDGALGEPSFTRRAAGSLIMSFASGERLELAGLTETTRLRIYQMLP